MNVNVDQEQLSKLLCLLGRHLGPVQIEHPSELPVSKVILHKAKMLGLVKVEYFTPIDFDISLTVDGMLAFWEVSSLPDGFLRTYW